MTQVHIFFSSMLLPGGSTAQAAANARGIILSGRPVVFASVGLSGTTRGAISQPTAGTCLVRKTAVGEAPASKREAVLDRHLVAGDLAFAVEAGTAFFRKHPVPNGYGVRPHLYERVCHTGYLHINSLQGPYSMISK